MARPFAKQFYSSQAWKSCRDNYMKKAHYLCEDCLAKGIYKPAKIVHHVEELTPLNIHRPEVSLSFENLRAVCCECHVRIHEDEIQKQKTKMRAKKRYAIDENGRVSAR